MLGGESSKNPRCDDDETEDDQGRERGKNKGPTYQDPTKIVATIFGGRAVSEDKREQKLVARRVMSVAMYDGPVADPMCKENGPLAHLLWILVFDDQDNQIGQMKLQVIVL